MSGYIWRYPFGKEQFTLNGVVALLDGEHEGESRQVRVVVGDQGFRIEGRDIESNPIGYRMCVIAKTPVANTVDLILFGREKLQLISDDTKGLRHFIDYAQLGGTQIHHTR